MYLQNILRARGFIHVHWHLKLCKFDRYMKSKRVLKNFLKIDNMLRFYVFLDSIQKRRETDAKFQTHYFKNYPSCSNILKNIHPKLEILMSRNKNKK